MTTYRVDVQIEDSRDGRYTMQYYVPACGPELAKEEAVELVGAEFAEYLIRHPRDNRALPRILSVESSLIVSR